MNVYKKIVGTLLSVMLTVGALAQVDSASIVIEQDEFDFGYVYESDGALVVTFKFLSKGGVPLKINRIIGTAFQIVDYSKDSIPKGGEGFVKVKFVPLNRHGDFNKTVKVFSNAKESPSELKIHGLVLSGSKKGEYKYNVGELAFKQSQLNFGYVFKGEELVRYIPVLNKSDKVLKIRFYDVPEHLTISPIFDELKPSQVGIIEVKYNSNKVNDWDFVYDRINIDVLLPNASKQASLTVTANVREDFSQLTEDEKLHVPKVSVPVRIFNFDTISIPQKASYEFLVKNNGERELKIRAVKPTCGCTAAIPLKDSVSPGDSTFIKVEFNSQGYSGYNKKGVTVITNDPQNYKQFLWVTGFVKP